MIEQADSKVRPIFLEVLLVNPARSLYERVGFCRYGQTTTHYLMSRQPNQPVRVVAGGPWHMANTRGICPSVYTPPA